MKEEKCHVDPLEKPLDHAAISEAMVAYLAVWGMGCPNCARRVRNSLLSLDGVMLVNIFLEQAMAVVAYDPKRVNSDELVKAVAIASNDGRHHYRAEVMTMMMAADALTSDALSMDGENTHSLIE